MSGMHVLGGMGVGKSSLATAVAIDDSKNGHGLLFIDTDGDSSNQLLLNIPQERMNDVILLDLVELGKRGRFIGVNPVTLADADRTMQIFKMRWKIGSETPRLENTLRACLLTLAYNKLTIAEIPVLLHNAT